MRVNSKVKAGVMLVVGVLVFWFLYNHFTQPSGPETAQAPGAEGAPGPTPTPAKPQIAKAAREIPPGSLITMADIRMEDVNTVAKGEVKDPNIIVGYVTNPELTLQKGATIHDSDLVGHISQVGVRGMLKPGTRAMSVGISGAGRNTMHEIVHIGDRVDIVSTIDQQESRLIVTDVRVLAVDVFGANLPTDKSVAIRGPYKAGTSDVPPPPPPPGTQPTPAPNATPPPPVEPALTLELTPKQVTQLQMAAALGSPIDYVIRPFQPPAATTLGGATAITVSADDQASTTRPQISNFAWGQRNKGADKKPGNTSTPRGPSISFPPPGGGGLPPMTPPVPPTYNIPIYGDGQLVRTETVARPK